MPRIVVIAAVIFAAVLALDAYPGLRGGAGWQWRYLAPRDWLPVAALALGLILYVAGTHQLRSRTIRGTVAWAVFGGTALAYLVVGIGGDPFFTLFTRTVSPVQTGASALQARIMADEGVLSVLRRWPQVMDEARGLNLIHFTTSPPGQPLLHQAAANLFDSPALAGLSEAISRPLRLYQCGDEDVMRYTRGEVVSAALFAYLMPFFAALTAVPLYLSARDLTGNRRLAAEVASWWPLVPAALLFAPTWNTVYPALCMLAFWLLLRALKAHRLGWAFASGLVMALATFLNFSVLPFFLLAGLFTLGWHWNERREQLATEQKQLTTEHTESTERHRKEHRSENPHRAANAILVVRRAAVTGTAFAFGLLLPWAVYTIATGVSPLDMLRVTFGAHGELVQRDYLPWLILHPYDVLLFTGLPAAVLAVWGAVKTIRSRHFDRLGIFALAMTATVLLVNFAGVVQGENGRILIYYMPVLLIVGAGAQRERGTDYDAPLLGAQAVVLLAMAAVLAVVPLDLDPMPTGPRTDIGGLGDVPWTEEVTPFVSAEFSGEFSLVRYRWIGDPSRQALTYEFEFLGESPAGRPYQFELLARADTDMGEIVSEPFRWWSQGAEYPPTCWREGDVVRDTVVMPLPAVPHPVVWQVSLRAVDERTGDAMLADGARALPLAPVRYP